MKKWFLLLVVVSFLSACRLDGFFFENIELEAYSLSAYEDDRVPLPESYDLSEDEYVQIALKSDDETLQAFYLGDTSKIDEDTVIVYCHGNAAHIDAYWNRVLLLANLAKKSYGVLIIDYRGFGMSTGIPTEAGLYTDIDAGIDWLKSKGLTNDRFILYGFSMGTAPACKLTAEPRSLSPMKLICEAPFASAEKMVQDATLLALPGQYVVNLKINNAELIKKVQVPLLWMHGKSDSFLTIDNHGEVFYKNYNGSWSEAYRVDGAEHSTLPTVMGFEEYSKAVLNFIRR